jgi:signal transduction histidine kinase
MNLQLQTILDAIQNSANLSEAEKELLVKSVKDADKAQGLAQFKLDRLERDKQTLSVMLEESIEDLQKQSRAVEEKNKELEIESALERVRSVAMGMKRPEDMLDVCRIISEQLELLQVKDIRNVQTAIFDEAKHIYMNYEYYRLHNKTFITEVDYTLHHVQLAFANQMLKGEGSFFTTTLTDTKLNEFIEHQKASPEFVDPFLFQAKSLTWYWYSLGPIAFGVSAYSPMNEAGQEIVKRFRNVFELAYRRYLDIEKAEAQAREAKIEAALEKVRSRSLAMYKSDELEQVVTVVNEKLRELGVSMEDRSASMIIFEEGSKDLVQWVASHEHESSSYFRTAYFDHPIFNDLLEAKEKGVDFFYKSYAPEVKNSYFRYFFEHSDYKLLPDSTKKWILETEHYALSIAYTKNSALAIVNLSGKPLSENQNDILKRFSRVFEQSYTRFLDLQKAEAQAREAKIEAALENVRSRSLAMHQSNEIKEVVKRVFEKMKELGFFQNNSVMIVLPKNGFKDVLHWTFNENFETLEYDIPAINHRVSTDHYEAWSRNEKTCEIKLTKEEKDDFLNQIFTYTDYSKVPEEFKKYLYTTEAYSSFEVFENHCGLLVDTFSSVDYTEDQKDVVKRFAKVFDQAYTRFLDLQKAEAQAREARIEVALEKVRSRTLAMQKSSELADVATVLFKELNQLVINLWTCGFVLCEKGRAEDEWWLCTEGGFIPAFYLPNVGDITHFNIYQGWLNGETYHTEQLEGEALEQHYVWLMNIPVTKKIFEDMSSAGFEKPNWQKLHCAYFSKGYLCIITREPCPEEEVFKRFAQVFDLTYTRFLDLQKAEAQTREALIEGALERVRARALAMQQPEELKDVAQVLRNEMGALGVEELETSSIYIHGESSENVECWYALQDPKHTEKKMVSDHFLLNLDDTWVGREMKKFYRSNEKQTSIVMQGTNRREWIEYCYKHSPVFTGFYGETIPDRTYHLYKFSHGYIGAASPGDISAESWRLLIRAASVFSLAYSRFRDLTQARTDLIKLKEEKKRAEDALTELQSAQKQLIQSEKMASLGELTAGIAHEIQNPLNFVNNFSDVSNELLEEMKTELDKGNTEDAKAIADDVKQNLEKILHHGKRADAIVKGMLQHSRSSSGVKEPTDINTLADEYLRLAYHGLRAKDKAFNAAMKTDYDESIGLVKVIPQDMGRVILNLITNAFYTVTEKKKLQPENYEPIVTVSTKAVKSPSGGLGAEVHVKDNGTGIPQKALDKIFQPFFTTKPTGQGTGLGLSLSYDIVKAHDGELKVETKEGEGTTFIISIPVN